VTRAQTERRILELLYKRAAGRTICPSEVARSLAASDERAAWEPWMQPVREAAAALVSEGRIVVTQRGQVVDLRTAKGPVRFRLQGTRGAAGASNRG
jgi:hypothetical protein